MSPPPPCAGGRGTYDLDCSGSICVDELAQLLKAIGISLRTTAVEDIMREVSDIVGDQHTAQMVLPKPKS